MNLYQSVFYVTRSQWKNHIATLTFCHPFPKMNENKMKITTLKDISNKRCNIKSMTRIKFGPIKCDIEKCLSTNEHTWK